MRKGTGFGSLRKSSMLPDFSYGSSGLMLRSSPKAPFIIRKRLPTHCAPDLKTCLSLCRLRRFGSLVTYSKLCGVSATPLSEDDIRGQFEVAGSNGRGISGCVTNPARNAERWLSALCYCVIIACERITASEQLILWQKAGWTSGDDLFSLGGTNYLGDVFPVLLTSARTREEVRCRARPPPARQQYSAGESRPRAPNSHRPK